MPRKSCWKAEKITGGNKGKRKKEKVVLKQIADLRHCTTSRKPLCNSTQDCQGWRSLTTENGLQEPVRKQAKETKGKETARKWTKELEQGYKQQRVNGQETDTRGAGSAHPYPSPFQRAWGPAGGAYSSPSPMPHPPLPVPPTQLTRGAASDQLPLSIQPATMTGGSRTIVKRSRDAALDHVKKEHCGDCTDVEMVCCVYRARGIQGTPNCAKLQSADSKKGHCKKDWQTM